MNSNIDITDDVCKNCEWYKIGEPSPLEKLAARINEKPLISNGNVYCAFWEFNYNSRLVPTEPTSVCKNFLISRKLQEMLDYLHEKMHI